jgi:predicted nucleotidyltransferase
MLASYCSANGIKSLEVFGSVARGQAHRGSDVDLIATFEQPIGLRFFGMHEDMAEILGVPVDLMTRQTLEQMTNPHRKNSILADARQILAF